MSGADLVRYIKRLASEAGFDRCGIARAEPIGREDYLRDWLAVGRAGSMAYLHDHFRQRVDPRQLLEGARSVVVVALNYHQEAPEPPDDRPRGRVARYAWGDDYHQVVKGKLFTMADRLRAELDDSFDAKACVDTAPLLEREVAAAAGIGWIGKNTMVMNQTMGSYFFLGALVTTLDLPPDEAVSNHCGTCTACLDACPTQAFPKAYEMDASRCISYLTIEHRGDIDKRWRGSMGDWIFGCDVCQEVCPFNRQVPETMEPRFAARSHGPHPVLDEVLSWSIDDYRANLRGRAGKRAKLEMWQRNARIARANAVGEARPNRPGGRSKPA